MHASWKQDFLFPDGKELLGEEAYRSYAKLVSHERYVTKKSRANEVTIEPFEMSDYLCESSMAEDYSSVEEMAITSVLYKKMKECMTELTTEDRFLIEELYFRNPNMSYCRIAHKLGLPRSTMQSREKRILESLRRMIEKS